MLCCAGGAGAAGAAGGGGPPDPRLPRLHAPPGRDGAQGAEQGHERPRQQHEARPEIQQHHRRGRVQEVSIIMTSLPSGCVTLCPRQGHALLRTHPRHGRQEPAGCDRQHPHQLPRGGPGDNDDDRVISG